VRSKRDEVPADLARVRERLKAWRQSRRPRERIPERLWDAAVKLVGSYGLNRTAATLKLDYYSLKERVQRSAAKNRDATAPAFLELAPAIAVARECVIEFDDDTGVRMRVHLKGYDAAEVVAVGRSFRNAQ